jgi:predicted dehydrogenase
VRIGFLGTGWIGRNRMQAMLATGDAEAAAICDPDPENLAQALELAPGAERARSLQELLGWELDGLVIATPSALHAEQCVAAFDRGLAVFCQKPLGRPSPVNPPPTLTVVSMNGGWRGPRLPIRASLISRCIIGIEQS